MTNKEYKSLEQLNNTKRKIKEMYNRLEKLINETKYDIERSLNTFENEACDIQDELDYEIDKINETFDEIENMKEEEVKE